MGVIGDLQGVMISGRDNDLCAFSLLRLKGLGLYHKLYAKTTMDLECFQLCIMQF